MIIFILTIAGGNSTALVSRCTSKRKTSIRLLKKVEQAGFVSKSRGLPNLVMMGGELCINATLAFASRLLRSGKLFTNGIKEPINYMNEKGKTTLQIPLIYKRKRNIILFDGIGFVFFNNKKKVSKLLLINLCKKYNLPAFGGIVYKGNRITPYIYVKEINSFVKETACGSGSIAFSILSGFNEIIQPTGEMISVTKNKEYFEISARVKLLNLKELNKLNIKAIRGQVLTKSTPSPSAYFRKKMGATRRYSSSALNKRRIK